MVFGKKKTYNFKYDLIYTYIQSDFLNMLIIHPTLNQMLCINLNFFSCKILKNYRITFYEKNNLFATFCQCDF